MKKLGLCLLAAVAVTGLSSVQALAWAINHHPPLSSAIGAGLESPHSATPDLWANQYHATRSELINGARYWAQMAKDTPWWDFYNKPVRAGFALHFVQDAGQPWHAAGKGASADHIAYELFFSTSIIATTGLSYVSLGSRYPIEPTSWTDIGTKMDALMNYTSSKISLVDTPAEWILNIGVTYNCLYQVGRYSKGLINYIY